MVRYIDADKLLREIHDKNIVRQFMPTEDDKLLIGILETIYKQPTADVAEVVRCRECKKHIGESIVGDTYCVLHDVGVPFDYYCASGERENELKESEVKEAVLKITSGPHPVGEKKLKSGKFCIVCGRRIPDYSLRKRTCSEFCRSRAKTGFAPFAGKG